MAGKTTIILCGVLSLVATPSFAQLLTAPPANLHLPPQTFNFVHTQSIPSCAFEIRTTTGGAYFSESVRQFSFEDHIRLDWISDELRPFNSEIERTPYLREPLSSDLEGVIRLEAMEWISAQTNLLDALGVIPNAINSSYIRGIQSIDEKLGTFDFVYWYQEFRNRPRAQAAADYQSYFGQKFSKHPSLSSIQSALRLAILKLLQTPEARLIQPRRAVDNGNYLLLHPAFQLAIFTSGEQDKIFSIRLRILDISRIQRLFPDAKDIQNEEKRAERARQKNSGNSTLALSPEIRGKIKSDDLATLERLARDYPAALYPGSASLIELTGIYLATEPNPNGHLAELQKLLQDARLNTNERFDQLFGDDHGFTYQWQGYHRTDQSAPQPAEDPTDLAPYAKDKKLLKKIREGVVYHIQFDHPPKGEPALQYLSFEESALRFIREYKGPLNLIEIIGRGIRPRTGLKRFHDLDTPTYKMWELRAEDTVYRLEVHRLRKTGVWVFKRAFSH